MTNTEIIDKIIEILSDAKDKKIEIHTFTKYTGDEYSLRDMTLQETLQYIIEQLFELREETKGIK